MATGDVNGYAYYTSGSGTTSLIFEYAISVGDKTDLLDYYSNREQVKVLHLSA